jgi:hypothetical protein
MRRIFKVNVVPGIQTYCLRLFVDEEAIDLRGMRAGGHEHTEIHPRLPASPTPTRE